MEKMMNKFLRSSVITSVILLALGLLLIFQSEATIYSISYLIGALLIAAGGVALVRFLKNISSEKDYDLDIVYGVVCIILGVLVINHPQAIASIIPIVLGIGIIVSSATKLQYTLQLKNKGNDAWKTTVVISIISLLCGVLLVFNPFKAAVGITRIVGIFITVYSVLDIISSFSIRHTVKTVTAEIDSVVEDAEVIKEEEKPKPKKKTTTKKKTTKKNAK